MCTSGSKVLAEANRIVRGLKLKEVLWSMKAFKNCKEGLITIGCFTLAAAVLPPLLNILMIPIGLLSTGFGGYQLYLAFKLKGPQQDAAKQLAGFSFIAAMILPVLSSILPWSLASLFVYRLYKNIEQIIPKNDRESSLGIFLQW